MAKKRTPKYVYYFGGKKADGKADMKNLLGGKGANLAEMVNIGIPVPAGFTITTEVCTEYNELGRDAVIEFIRSDVEEAIAYIESLMNTTFGDAKNPLLISVRSGARVADRLDRTSELLALGRVEELALGRVEEGRERLAHRGR